MKNKRGQGLTTTTIILLVLGIFILVMLIVGFTMGWSQFGEWLSTDNVQTIVTQCEIACSSNSIYEFCSKPRTLKAEGEEIPGTCYEFSVSSSLVPYGIDQCVGLCKFDTCEDSNGYWESECFPVISGEFTDDPEDGSLCCSLEA